MKKSTSYSLAFGPLIPQLALLFYVEPSFWLEVVSGLLLGIQIVGYTNLTRSTHE